MILKVEDLCFSYDTKTVLKEINIEIAEQEVLTLLGPNGSGKSTLVKCLNGLLRPQRGQVSVNGLDLQKMSNLERAKEIAYVPQSTEMLYSQRVFDVVLMGRKPHAGWRCSEEDLDIAADTIATMDLSSLALDDYASLSGGQKQRVQIARALAQRPKVLLMDEPTSALDIAHQLELMDLIRELSARHGLTVIMVIHDLNLAARFSDRVALLKEGGIYGCGGPASVLNHRCIKDVYEVDVEISYSGSIPSIVPVKTTLCPAGDERKEA